MVLPLFLYFYSKIILYFCQKVITSLGISKQCKVSRANLGVFFHALIVFYFAK